MDLRGRDRGSELDEPIGIGEARLPSCTPARVSSHRSPSTASSPIPRDSPGRGPTTTAFDLRPNDVDALIELTARLQGAEQARFAQYWLDRQPSGFRLFRAPPEK